jgi:hypothetical protein
MEPTVKPTKKWRGRKRRLDLRAEDCDAIGVDRALQPAGADSLSPIKWVSTAFMLENNSEWCRRAFH